MKDIQKISLRDRISDILDEYRDRDRRDVLQDCRIHEKTIESIIKAVEDSSSAGPAEEECAV
jgi:hypothetical protein